MNMRGKPYLMSAYIFIILISSCNLEPYSKGKQAYEVYCASCHMKDGTGLVGLIPPIAGADYYAQNQDNITCIIVNGLQDSIVVNGRSYDQKMDPINLTPIQITNIINYMNQSWGNNLPVKSIEDVKKELDQCTQ
jgi:mono/diheme cytochrome c family protein